MLLHYCRAPPGVSKGWRWGGQGGGGGAGGGQATLTLFVRVSQPERHWEGKACSRVT